MRSIRTKITLTYLILASLVIGLLGVILSYEFERFMHDRLVNELTTDTSVLTAYLKEVAFPPHSRAEVEATLSAIAATKEMQQLIVHSLGMLGIRACKRSDWLGTLSLRVSQDAKRVNGEGFPLPAILQMGTNTVEILLESGGHGFIQFSGHIALSHES